MLILDGITLPSFCFLFVEGLDLDFPDDFSSSINLLCLIISLEPFNNCIILGFLVF